MAPPASLKPGPADVLPTAAVSWVSVDGRVRVAGWMLGNSDNLARRHRCSQGTELLVGPKSQLYRGKNTLTQRLLCCWERCRRNWRKKLFACTAGNFWQPSRAQKCPGRRECSDPRTSGIGERGRSGDHGCRTLMGPDRYSAPSAPGRQLPGPLNALGDKANNPDCNHIHVKH